MISALFPWRSLCTSALWIQEKEKCTPSPKKRKYFYEIRKRMHISRMHGSSYIGPPIARISNPPIHCALRLESLREPGSSTQFQLNFRSLVLWSIVEERAPWRRRWRRRVSRGSGTHVRAQTADQILKWNHALWTDHRFPSHTRGPYVLLYLPTAHARASCGHRRRRRRPIRPRHWKRITYMKKFQVVFPKPPT